jgi:tetratricopeptide (TPR) repeat protein
MARLAVIVLVITLSFVLVGCHEEASKSQVATATTTSSTAAVVAPSDANSLFAEAVHLEEQAGPLMVGKDEALLKKALDKYEQFINKYPKSDKISDAAYRMAGIYQYLKDYTNALKYYQRTYQWDPQTPTVARFKAAYILDTQFGRRAEALQIYQEALSKITRSNEHWRWVEYAQQRVRELTGEVKPLP